jgi:hypothetical protein
MIQVRDKLQVKFGKIDQAVELFTKASFAAMGWPALGQRFEVLTDVSGPMYTMISAFVAPDLGEFERQRDRQFEQPEFEPWFKQYQLFIEGGRREFYNLEGEYESWSAPGRIVVRESYQAFKWQIQSAVGLLQRYGALMAGMGVGQHPRILTDASGPMFQAIIEIETESMSAWESQRRLLFQEIEFQVWFNQLRVAVVAGKHEFFRVEYAAG